MLCIGNYYGMYGLMDIQRRKSHSRPFYTSDYIEHIEL